MGPIETRGRRSKDEVAAEVDRRVSEFVQDFLDKETEGLSVPEKLEVEKQFESGRDMAKRTLQQNMKSK